METNASVQPYAIAYDLENCDQEPIQFIRFVQQHACLLSVNLESLKITQATDNTAQFLNVPLDTVLQAPLSALLPTDIMDTINQALAAGEIEQINPLPLPISPK
ncbi:MAG: hypothetical protein KDC44_25240, partial [Phaeodactylibacter sp.]|nr:hypothetical protein [Phaeodactylibacter sp.]